MVIIREEFDFAFETCHVLDPVRKHDTCTSLISSDMPICLPAICTIVVPSILSIDFLPSIAQNACQHPFLIRILHVI